MANKCFISERPHTALTAHTGRIVKGVQFQPISLTNKNLSKFGTKYQENWRILHMRFENICLIDSVSFAVSQGQCQTDA